MREGADLVDRADDRAESQRSVCANNGLEAAAFVDEGFAGFHVAAFEQREKRHARFRALLRRGSDRNVGVRLDAVDAGARRLGVDGIALETDEVASEFFATAPVVPVPKNGSSTTSPGLEEDEQNAREQRFGLLGRMDLAAVRAFQALVAGAERE